jgi:hypothetical protein
MSPRKARKLRALILMARADVLAPGGWYWNTAYRPARVRTHPAYFRTLHGAWALAQLP